MKVRHQARVAALQTLYEVDTAHHDAAIVIERRLEESSLPDAGEQFARHLVEGVSLHCQQLDALIGRYAPDWPVDQIAIIDRNVLRISIFEILIHRDTPTKVAINEAVELAKKFGSDSSSRFINGVLGTLVANEPDAGKR